MNACAVTTDHPSIICMKTSTLLPLLCFMALTCFADAPAVTWKAAAARAKITPDTLMWMAGYASRTKPADGTTLDLFAKTLVIEDTQQQRLVIVTLDLIGVPKSMRDDLSQRLAKEHGIEPAALLINASHTHSGPELRATRTDTTDEPNRRADEATAYTQQLEARIVSMVGDCLARLQPARLQYGYARCGFAMNRRTPKGTGYSNHPYPQGPVDHQVPVLRISDAKGAELALAFGYACHSTTLALQQFSGDYPGYAQQAVEAAHPGAVAMFINGCSGDQNPYPRGKVEQAETHGRSLASAVDAALATDLVELTGTLRVALEEIPLAYSPLPTQPQLADRAKSGSKLDAGHAGRLLSVLKERGSLPTHYPYPVQVLRIGDQLTLAALGGEVVVDYSLRLKREIQDAHVWVAGYSNDVMTYIPSLRVLKEGGYEAGDAMKWGSHPAPWSTNVEEQIVGTALRLRQGLK